ADHAVATSAKEAAGHLEPVVVIDTEPLAVVSAPALGLSLGMGLAPTLAFPLADQAQAALLGLHDVEILDGDSIARISLLSRIDAFFRACLFSEFWSFLLGTPPLPLVVAELDLVRLAVAPTPLGLLSLARGFRLFPTLRAAVVRLVRALVVRTLVLRPLG